MSQKQEIQSQSEEKRLENIMKEHPFPRAWKWMKLGEVCVVTKNRDPRITPDLPFRYVDISSVNNRLKRITDTRTILGKDAPSRARQIIKANDVIVSMTRPNLNAVALVPEDLNNEICSTGFCVLRPTEFIDALFLFEFVQSKYFIETVSGKVRGMLYPAITDNQVREVNIPIPPLPEQKKIAIKTQELIQTVENARIACEKQLEAAKALPSAYLREVFESEEAKKWERKRLGEVLLTSPQYGLTAMADKFEKDYIYIRITDITDNGKIKTGDLRFIELEKETFEKYRVCNGDILIARSGSVGRIYLVKEYDLLKPAVFASYLIRFKLNSDTILPQYFFYFGLSDPYKNFISDQIKTVAQPNINAKQYQNLQIPLPPLGTQRHIVNYLKEKMAYVENLQSAICSWQSAIETLPQAILRKAFKGELW